ncbi:hypothetical protein B0H13DRAFT_1878746 [Mycena leptocephala]|nr:hypothetical protein B0H13DRAFT_1878746 [Mycena leptocephala]
MFFSRALLVSALIVPTVLGVPSALSGNAVDIDARGSSTPANTLALVSGTLTQLGVVRAALAAILATHSTCSAVSQAQAQVKALTSCLLSSTGPLVSCATGQNVLGPLLSTSPLGAGLCSLNPSDPLSTLSGLLGGLLGGLGGLGGILNLNCLVTGILALLESILGLTGCGCDASLVSELVEAVQELVRSLNALLACGGSCASCHGDQFISQVSALIGGN